MNLTQELLSLLQRRSEGVTDEELSTHFGRGVGLPAVYRIIKEETANKLEGLGRDHILVYNVCEKSGDKGIWKQDIRYATNIQQQNLDKILKLLEQKLLIKTVRSIGSKTKKLYMLYDVTPAKEITGGPWYTDQEFDHEFVEALCTFILQLVQSKGMVDVHTISARVKSSGICTVDLSIEELELVLQTLIYDRKIEMVQPSAMYLTGQPTAAQMQTHYKISPEVAVPSFVTATPCGVCTLIKQCCEGGIISPSTCEYMTQWLAMADEPVGDMSW